MDWSLLHTLNDFLAGHDGVEDPVLWYVNAAEILFIALLAVLFLLTRGRTRATARRAAIAAGCSAGVALAIGAVISRLVDRARPFVADPSGVHLFARHAADAGFPSDHATASFAIAVAIFLRMRRCGVLALAMAIVVSVGRVAAGLHYPTDVLGGAALGAATALGLWHPVIRRALHRLADGLGQVWDGMLGALAGALRVTGRD